MNRLGNTDIEVLRLHCDSFGLGDRTTAIKMRDLHAVRDSLMKSGETVLARDLEGIESGAEFEDLLVNTVYGDL